MSLLGDGITRLLVLYLASKLTSNPMIFSFILIAGYLPGMLGGAFVGPIVDRYDKKKIMVFSDLYRFVIVLLMISAQSSLSWLLVLIFLQGVGNLFFEPAKTALIPSLIKKEFIPEAVAFSQSTFMVMAIIAPSIGGILLLSKQYSLIFLLDAATFMISGLILLFLRSKSGEAVGEEIIPKNTYRESLREGVYIIRNNSFLIGLLSLMTIGIFVMGLINANIYAITLNIYKLNEVQFGTLESLEGIFGVAGSFAVPFIMKKCRNNTLLMLTFGLLGVMGLLTIPIYEVHGIIPFVPLYIWMCMTSFFSPFLNIPINSMLMQRVPEKVLGRISGIMGALINFSILAGLILGGWSAAAIGPIWTVTIAGFLLFVISILFPFTKFYGELIAPTAQAERTEKSPAF
ncbi:MFS transporter [Rossellomorea marisflavi]|uniref:MFS transporter n=1 Tax=Rossellomorea marisflavi TaxID=189381 RepID=UPI0027A6C62F|nr:MFS transporter [Rossellomorea marisflavi]UTE71389.1 MFS transporter [Rossellomorea marisflavi]